MATASPASGLCRPTETPLGPPSTDGEPSRDEDSALAATEVSVVVAEDENNLRQALCELLGNFGFRIVGEASNGHEAVALSAEFGPDVALLDLRMPEMDGLAAARYIRKRTPWTQVVILTAYEDASLRLEAEQAGVYCYLVKGCGPGLIRDVLLQARAMKASLEARAGSSPRRGSDS